MGKGSVYCHQCLKKSAIDIVTILMRYSSFFAGHLRYHAAMLATGTNREAFVPVHILKATGQESGLRTTGTRLDTKPRVISSVGSSASFVFFVINISVGHLLLR